MLHHGLSIEVLCVNQQNLPYHYYTEILAIVNGKSVVKLNFKLDAFARPEPVDTELHEFFVPTFKNIFDIFLVGVMRDGKTAKFL